MNRSDVSHTASFFARLRTSLWAICSLCALLILSAAAPDGEPRTHAPREKEADLSLTMTVDNPVPIEGTDVTFTITVENDGPDNTKDVVVTDLLPAGLTFVSADPSKGSYDGGSGAWDLGKLNKNRSQTLTLVARVNTTATVTNTAEVTSSKEDDPDSTPGNGDPVEDDQASVTLTPVPRSSVDVCYLVADGGDELTWVVRATGQETDLGPVGVSRIEAAAYRPVTGVLYAADADRLGTLDPATGAFSALGSTFGTGDGAEGSVTFSDVDGLAFDPFTGRLYGAHRRNGPDDLLFVIDPATGAHVPDAFGSGVDYVVVPSTAAVGFQDLDDLAIDPADGRLYAIANNGGTGDRLIRIDKLTGDVTDVGALGQNDMEGLSFDALGQLYGTTGAFGGAHKNGYFTIDKTSGTAAFIAELEAGSDYESIACLTDGVNEITGKVFLDVDADGLFGGSDAGAAGVTVRLYRDNDGDGTGDVLVTSMLTDASGDYAFTLAATGAFVLDIDTTDLPGGAVMTTDNAETAAFSGFGNTDAANDFGYTQSVDLALTKTVDEPAPATNTNVVFTLTLTNDGPNDATGILVTDTWPDSLAFVSAAPAQGTYDALTGVWDVGSLAAGDTVRLDLTATVLAETTPQINVAEVTAIDQTDRDATPGNGDPTEDDQDNATVSPTGSSGGDDSGLESNGSLARTLARVLYRRRLLARANPPVKAPPFEPARESAGKTGAISELIAFIPQTGPQQSRAFVVSPSDLLPVTNATGVFAVDYVRSDDVRLGALFAATTPPGEIYEHTKVVCDRLRGAALEAVRLVPVAGHLFLLAQLRHENGAVDYAVSFVVYRTGEGFTIDSRFRRDEYAPPTGGDEVYNFQVWSVSKAYTQDLVARILYALSAEAPLTFRNTDEAPPELPRVFVRQGRYAQGRLTLEVVNAAGAETLRLTGGAVARTESGAQEFFDAELPLPKPEAGGAPVVTVEAPVGPVFDAAFFIETERGGARDQLYLADGAWSFAHDVENARVGDFEIFAQDASALNAPGQWIVERDARLTGEVKTWAVLFRYLQSNARPLDLSAYRYLEFTASGEGQVRLFLEKASITTANHFGAVVRLTPEPKRHRIRFRDLRRIDGGGVFTAEDLVLLSFYVMGDQAHTRPFDLKVEDLRFGGGAGDALAGLPDTYELDQNYPNPFNPTTTIAFGLPEAGPVRLTVFDLLGRRVAVLADGWFEAGRHALPFNARNLAGGAYLYRLRTPGRTLTRTMVLMK
ncbi:SdrD B-like domain-containing protein [Rhodocaloribacter sp.]